MPTPVIHSAEFSEGYRVTSTGEGLLVETTDHHPFPLRLSREQLSSFGLQYKDDHYIPLTQPAADAEEKSEGVVDASSLAFKTLSDWLSASGARSRGGGIS